jgi:glutamate-1-semialdehyde 2,1-aminomutase
MTRTTKRSEELYRRSLDTMIEGGSSPSRGPANYGDYPLFMERGEGAHIYDVDGNRYLDWMMSYGALPLGHAHPEVVEAIQTAAAGGSHFATATEIEVEVAELLQKAIPGAERIRFANTGTEATMAALRLARGFTGRPKFVKFEGHYHGWFDDFLVNSHPQPTLSLGHRNDPIKIADSSGLNRRSLEDTIVVPWNDMAAIERAFATWGGQIAAVFTEGIMANMGVIPPAPGYLKALRQLTRHHDTLLILDETVTGFRIAPGGCQEYYDVHADIVTLGKGLGAGLPVAAFVGQAKIMESLAWGSVLHYGTQNASRIGMHAARANLKCLLRDDGAAFHHTWRIGEELCTGLREIFQKTSTPAIVQNIGPMLQILFTEKSSIDDYREFCSFVDRDRYRRFALALFEHGVYMTPSATLHSVASLAHTDEDVAYTLEAVETVLSGPGDGG